jgi:hypothetical protein
VHDRRQRRHGEGRRLLSHDREESACAPRPSRSKTAFPRSTWSIRLASFCRLQEDVFPDTDDFGRVFRNNAVMSSLGIPQITAIMGMCVAGGAYLTRHDGYGAHDRGLGTVSGRAVAGAGGHRPENPAEELGGAAMHAEISGTVDFKEPNDQQCIARLRSLVEKMGRAQRIPRRAAAGLFALFDAAATRRNLPPKMFTVCSILRPGREQCV